MSIFNKGSKLARVEQEREEARQREVEAEQLKRQSLEVVEHGLRVKREVREKAARFVGSLRPLHGKPTT